MTKEEETEVTNEERARELVNRLDLWVQANRPLDGKGRDPDFWLIGAITSTLDGADARGYARGLDKLLIEFGKFRMALRQILADVGIGSNSGWSDDNVLVAIRNALSDADARGYAHGLEEAAAGALAEGKSE